MVGHSLKVATFYRVLMASPLKMCSRFDLENWTCSAKSLEMVRKWLMAQACIIPHRLFTRAKGIAKFVEAGCIDSY